MENIMSSFRKWSHFLEELKQAIDEGLIRYQTDGKDLFIFNYTEVCQFGKQWNDVSLMSRGLVVNKDGDIVARPLKKFFNCDENPLPFADPLTLEQHIQEHGTPIIIDKVDGSLGILFYYYEKWNLATRGSFNSDQAREGKKILDDMYKGSIDTAENQPDRGSTHLFEIIYPENRIVLNYGEDRKLIYLLSINTQTGEEFYDPNLTALFEMPQVYEKMEVNVPNKEGYVLVFPDGFRIKIKHDEYKRLHRIMTGLTDKGIFECVSHNVEIDLTGVPEEFRDDVEKKIKLYKKQFKALKKKVKNVLNECINEKTGIQTRRDIAIKFQQNWPDIQGLLFSELDGKLSDDKVWKKIQEMNQFKTEKIV